MLHAARAAIETYGFVAPYVLDPEGAIAGSLQLRVGLPFADRPPEHDVRTAAVGTTDFEIPPHAADLEVVAEHRFATGGGVLMLLPRMHLRGKAFRYELARAADDEAKIRPDRARPGAAQRGRVKPGGSRGDVARPAPGPIAPLCGDSAAVSVPDPVRQDFH